MLMIKTNLIDHHLYWDIMKCLQFLLECKMRQLSPSWVSQVTPGTKETNVGVSTLSVSEVWTQSKFTALLVYCGRLWSWPGHCFSQLQLVARSLIQCLILPLFPRTNVSKSSRRSKIKFKPIISIVYLHCLIPLRNSSSFNWFELQLAGEPHWSVSSLNTTTFFHKRKLLHACFVGWKSLTKVDVMLCLVKCSCHQTNVSGQLSAWEHDNNMTSDYTDSGLGMATSLQSILTNILGNVMILFSVTLLAWCLLSGHVSVQRSDQCENLSLACLYVTLHFMARTLFMVSSPL